MKSWYKSAFFVSERGQSAWINIGIWNLFDIVRIFWIFTGIIDAIVVSWALYYYRGLLGLILSIIVYLPSLSIYLWIIERAMEEHPVIPSQVRHRMVIVFATIFFQIFFFWWLLEIGNGVAGWLGIGIASLIFLSMQLYIYFYWRKKRHNRQVSSP